MGRPRKKELELLAKAISIRLTESEHKLWNQKVRDSGMTASEFFRQAIIRNKTSIHARKPVSVDKKRLIYLFNKTSNNMNQIAYRANVEHLKGIISKETYTDILKLLLDISAFMKRNIDHVD